MAGTSRGLAKPVAGDEIGGTYGMAFHSSDCGSSPHRSGSLPPIRFPCSPERWWGDEALKAEAQAAQAPREQGHQAACNILAMHSRSLFSAGVRFATASHMPVDTAQ